MIIEMTELRRKADAFVFFVGDSEFSLWAILIDMARKWDVPLDFFWVSVGRDLAGECPDVKHFRKVSR
jgi:hypothetical protein